MVNGAVDSERYEGRVVRTVRESIQKCVSNPKYKALYVHSPGIPKTVKLKIAVKSKGNE